MAKIYTATLSFLLIVFTQNLDAKTLYVTSSGGNDSTSYASNGPGAKWATVCRAIRGTTNCATSNSSESAQPGDLVLIDAGTYAVAGNNTKFPVYNSVNSGTALLPIIISPSGGHVIFTFLSGSGAMLGCNNVNYVRWVSLIGTSEFQINEVNAPSRSDTGSEVMWDTIGCVIDGTRVDAGGWPYDHSHTPVAITSSNATTNEITTASAHNLSPGEGVLITGHTGATFSPTDSRDYYVIATAPTTTTLTLNYRFTLNAVDITVSGTGGTISRRRNDNHACMYSANAVNSTYRNNVCFNNTGYGMNSGGVVTYFSDGLTIEYNLFYDLGSGIFLKGNAFPTQNFYIRYNIIYNIEEAGIAYHRTTLASPSYANIYQNIIYNTGTRNLTYPDVQSASGGIRIFTFDAGANEPVRARIVNNTINNSDFCLFVSGTLVSNSGHLFYNNICGDMISDTSTAYQILGRDATSVSTTSQFISDYNLFKSPIRWGTGPEGSETDYTTIASWRSATNQDTNSSTGDPLFVNAVSNDYRLSVGSPGLSGGLDILDLDCDTFINDTIPRGAYITGSETFGPNGNASCSIVSAPRYRFRFIAENLLLSSSLILGLGFILLRK